MGEMIVTCEAFVLAQKRAVVVDDRLRQLLEALLDAGEDFERAGGGGCGLGLRLHGGLTGERENGGQGESELLHGGWDSMQ